MVSVQKETPSIGSTKAALPYVATTPNCWSSDTPTYRFGVTEAKGPRRTMEDAHSYTVDYAGIHGQGFFAIFDGHAGKEAADWCGEHFHKRLLQAIHENPEMSIPDVYNTTFHAVDRVLSKISEDSDGKMHSGCTAVTAFLRIEDTEGQQSFADALSLPSPPLSPASSMDQDTNKGQDDVDDVKKSPSPSKFKRAIQKLSHSSPATPISPEATPRSQSPNNTREGAASGAPQRPPPGQSLRRVLYVANAGDARGVLCRGGKALRLTYDHKGTDKQEAKRIMDSGGFVMSGRVNGVLAVTRSLGDSSMKDFVVGAPYTTETELTEDDEFLILACDGVWDVLDDQAAANLIRTEQNPQAATETLLREALRLYTNDNITVMVIRFKDVPADAKGSSVPLTPTSEIGDAMNVDK